MVYCRSGAICPFVGIKNKEPDESDSEIIAFMFSALPSLRINDTLSDKM